jgi:hypothetical protein
MMKNTLKLILTNMLEFWPKLKRSLTYQKMRSTGNRPMSKSDPEAQKVYVLVRKDILSDIQVGVQATHAVVEMLDLAKCYDRYPSDWVDNYRTLIFLAANEYELEEMKRKCDAQDVLFCGFREPDLNNIETAVAFEPVTVEKGFELFGGFELV